MRPVAFILSMLTMVSVQAFSQKDTCNCLANLDRLIEKTEENYAGFPAKVNSGTSKRYRDLIESLRKKSINETRPKTCFYLLKEYIQFFKDKHFILSYVNSGDYDNERMNYSEAYFKKAWAKTSLSPVEGIWVNADSSVKLAVQKSGNNIYKGIVIQSTDSAIPKGLVYFTLTKSAKGFIAKEYDRFLTTETPAKQKGNLLQLWNHAMFGKIYPTSLTKLEKEELNTWRNNNNGLWARRLSAKTALLKIPTFLNNDDKIMDIVKRNDSLIKSCDNLIVDLTGNGGGNTGWVSFLHYFMTNDIVQYDSYLRVTPENIKYKLSDLELFAVNPVPEEYRKYFPDKVLAAYKKAYHELPATKEAFYPIPGVVFPLDSVLPRPGKIALVVDDLCGSSTEYFFFLSRQSKKTVTYGINTIGLMDYEGMSNPTPMPYDKFILTIPVVRSSWTDKNPIDQTGFKPDVLLNHIPQEKWIEFIQKDLERKR